MDVCHPSSSPYLCASQKPSSPSSLKRKVLISLFSTQYYDFILKYFIFIYFVQGSLCGHIHRRLPVKVRGQLCGARFSSSTMGTLGIQLRWSDCLCVPCAGITSVWFCIYLFTCVCLCVRVYAHVCVAYVLVSMPVCTWRAEMGVFISPCPFL